MFATLNRERELLLDEVAERGTTAAHELVLVREALRVACMWARVGEQQRLEVVVHCVSNEHAVFEDICYLLLHFFEWSG